MIQNKLLLSKKRRVVRVYDRVLSPTAIIRQNVRIPVHVGPKNSEPIYMTHIIVLVPVLAVERGSRRHVIVYSEMI